MRSLISGRFGRAIEWADRRLHDQPRYNPARQVKIAAEVRLGHLHEAWAEFGRMLAIQPGVTIASFRANSARQAAPEYIDAIVTGPRQAGLPEE